MSNQIRDLVHTIKSADLTPNQIENAFGEIFLSRDTIENQLESQEIVSMFQAVKVPTYGHHIPNTATIVVKGGESGLTKLFTAENNKTYKILALSVANAGDAQTFQFGLQNDSGDYAVIEATMANASTDNDGITVIDRAEGITFDNSVFPAFLITSGDVNDLAFSMAYCEIVQ
jgi:hypothetical protein